MGQLLLSVFNKYLENKHRKLTQMHITPNVYTY